MACDPEGLVELVGEVMFLPVKDFNDLLILEPIPVSMISFGIAGVQTTTKPQVISEKAQKITGPTEYTVSAECM